MMIKQGGENMTRANPTEYHEYKCFISLQNGSMKLTYPYVKQSLNIGVLCTDIRTFRL